jgi:hypothetical protein
LIDPVEFGPLDPEACLRFVSEHIVNDAVNRGSELPPWQSLSRSARLNRRSPSPADWHFDGKALVAGILRDKLAHP